LHFATPHCLLNNIPFGIKLFKINSLRIVPPIGTTIANCKIQNHITGGKKMFNLKSIIYKFERLMTAVTFAEAGQSDTALEIMKERPVGRSNRKAAKVINRVDQRPVLRA
jgi:hypothetical protein